MLVLSPKREEAQKLGTKVENLPGLARPARSRNRSRRRSEEGFADSTTGSSSCSARRSPATTKRASLLVQLNRIAETLEGPIREPALESSGSGGERRSGAGGRQHRRNGADSPTEAAASLMPLGARSGRPGSAVMPYSLTFNGDLLPARRLHPRPRLDGDDRRRQRWPSTAGCSRSTGSRSKPTPEAGFPKLEGEFSVTTFLTPPGEGVSRGRDPETGPRRRPKRPRPRRRREGRRNEWLKKGPELKMPSFPLG